MPSSGWPNNGTVEVLLPSGTWVRLLLPSLRHLLRHGVLPTRLHEAALQAAEPAWLREEGKEDERQQQVGEYVSMVIAWAVRASSTDRQDWTPLALTAEDVVMGDQLDLDALEDVVLRDKTPIEVTRRSQARLGMALDPITSEVSISGWTAFRGGTSGAETGADSTGVEPATEPVAGGG